MGDEAGLITFSEARALAEAEVAPLYPDADFVASPTGWENDTDYQLEVRPYVLLHKEHRDGTPLNPDEVGNFIFFDTPWVSVAKATGEVTLHYPDGTGEPFEIPNSVEVRDE